MYIVRQLVVFAVISAVVLGCGGSSKGSDAAEPPAINQKVLNVVELARSQSPEIVELLTDRSSCTAALISYYQVITAAHCVVEAEVAYVRDSDRYYPVQAMHVHPNYEVNERGLLYDVALVDFSPPADRTLVTLPLLVTYDPELYSVLQVFGFGIADVTKSPWYFGTLRTGSVLLSETSELFHVTHYSDHLSSVCYGDSGGPLIYTAIPRGLASELQPANARAMVAGVTSFTTELNCQGDSHYTRLQNEEVLRFLLELAPEAEYF